MMTISEIALMLHSTVGTIQRKAKKYGGFPKGEKFLTIVLGGHQRYITKYDREEVMAWWVTVPQKELS